MLTVVWTQLQALVHPLHDRTWIETVFARILLQGLPSWPQLKRSSTAARASQDDQVHNPVLINVVPGVGSSPANRPSPDPKDDHWKIWRIYQGKCSILVRRSGWDREKTIRSTCLAGSPDDFAG